MSAIQLLIVSITACCLMATGASPAQQREWKVTNTAELIAAVNDVPAEGGIITLAPGTFEITESLVFKSKSQVKLQGSGWSTIIKKKGDGDAIVFQGSCWNCRVYGMTINGDPEAKKGSGIVYREGQWSGICVIDYCHIDYFPEHGISYEGTAKTPFSSNTISNCWLTNNLGDQIHSVFNNDFYMFGNQLGTGPGRTPRSGTFLDRSSAGTYTMNYHWGNKVALRLAGVNFNRIENNRFEQSRENGILFGDPKSSDVCMLNIVTGNTIHTNAEGNSGKFNAVEAYNTVDTTFTSNQIFSWDCNSVKAKSGIALGKGCRTWIIKDNIIRHFTTKPIVYNPKDGHVVKDNITD